VFISTITMKTSFWEAERLDHCGHLFPSDNHKAAMDAIAGELMR
jgi:hypothetical protein